MRTPLIATALVIVIGTTILTAQTPPAAPPKGDSQNGAKLFVKYGCFECHGREGQGGAAGPRRQPAARAAPAAGAG